MFYLQDIKMTFLRLGFSAACLLMLSSCSGTYHAYGSMLKLAFTSAEDVQLTYADVEQANYDYLYVKQGDNAQIAMGLAYIEQDQLKWVSGDSNMLITSQGRIVRTLGLSNDLMHVTSKAKDPLHHPLAISAQTTYQRQVDWRQGEYGYKVNSEFAVPENESLEFFGQMLQVVKLTETLQYDNPTNFIRFDAKWQNTFWLEAKTGRVVKTSQQLQPGAPRFELVFISEVVRQFKAAGITVSPEAL